MHAYVLIGLLEREEQQVLDELLSYKEIIDAHILFGEWDIIAKIEGKTSEDVGTFIMEKIRSLQNVKITSTLIVAK